jgi:hypothetical protein
MVGLELTFLSKTTRRSSTYKEASTSVADLDKVDFPGIEKDSENIILIVSDHLDWGKPINRSNLQ